MLIVKIKRNIAHICLRNPRRAVWVAKHNLKLFLWSFYYKWVGRFLNYEAPEDFNQWLLLQSLNNSRSPEMRRLVPLCVDKYAVRDYISRKGYADTLNDLIGVYERVEDVDFEALPDAFVMKMNNASGRNYICADKSKCDWEQVKKQFAAWLTDREFGWTTGEWQYSLIEPRIVVEKYLENLGETSLIDYKFNCVNGKVISCFVGYNRNPEDPHGEVSYDDYDLEWNRTEAIKEDWHPTRKLLKKPELFDRMIQMAEECTKGLPYCRFDVYEVDGKILFGEMTFTPQGCVLEFYKDEWLREMLAKTK